MIDQQVLKENWNDLKGRLREKWSELAEDDLQAARGDAQQLVGVIQRRTGEARDQIERQLEDLLAQGGSALSRAGETVRRYAGDISHEVADGVSHAAQAGRERYREAADRAGELYEQVEDAARRHPAESLLIAMGVGIVVGVALGVALGSPLRRH